MTAALIDTWRQGYARLRALQAPAGVPPEWWGHLAPDMAAFCRQWAPQAVALGWDTLSLFGAHPRQPDTRWDYMGLLLLLQGERVVELTDWLATLRKQNQMQSIVAKLATVPADAVPVWEIG